MYPHTVSFRDHPLPPSQPNCCDQLFMTVTVEELEAEGWPEAEQIAHWEYNNKGMQSHMFAVHFHLTPLSLHRWWPLKDVHAFCLKLCAIYATVSLGGARELCIYLWTKWFRQGVTPCRFENFLARYVGSYKPESPKSIPELLDAHRRICSQVLLRQVTLTAEDKPLKPLPQTVDDRLDNRYVNHENFHLEALFHALFIVIDTKPRQSSRCRLTYDERLREDTEILTALPVLLVRTGEFHDLRMGPIDFAAIESVSEMVDGNKDVRRIALGDAVDFVLELHRQNTEFD
ncbi:MAG: hypothetical protein LQ341_001883 [Variospora aurantia]|nr:MAG: hypothetical protein LQ341_001883 [Variospora aurantia]